MESLRRLLPYYRLHRGTLWSGLGLLLLARVFEAFIPQFLKRGIDGLAGDGSALGLMAWGIALCVIARYISIWFGRRAVRRLGVEVAFDLRNRLYAQLERQGAAFFASHRTGDLMARAINDIGLIRRLVAAGTRTVVVLFFSSGVAFAFMLSESPSLTLLLILPMPLIFWAALFMSRRLYQESMAVQTGFSSLSNRVQENLGGIRTIQVLNQEPLEIRNFAASNQDYTERNLALVRRNSLIASLMPALGTLSVLVVLYFGGLRVLAGEITLGTFTAFVWYLNMVLWPVREAGNMINLFQRGAAGTTRLFELLDAEPEIADRPALSAPETLEGALQLSGVTLRHPGADAPALSDIDLEVRAGETLAILGKIGAGKSTLLRLLVRLLDPSSGSVRIDGYDVRELPLARLRAQVALVPQEVFLFAESVFENISYDEPDRPRSAVVEAAALADLTETLARFPAGLETLVGERGVLVSGGQKQRLALARGLIRDAPVLLLDDPFSSVDSETELRILQGLARVRKDRTTLVVSHRVSAARTADRILVLDAGRVVETGTPAELLAANGAFAALARVQQRRDRLLADLEEGGEAA